MDKHSLTRNERKKGFRMQALLASLKLVVSSLLISSSISTYSKGSSSSVCDYINTNPLL